MQIKKMTAELSNAGHPQMLKERSSKSACASGKVFELLPPGRLAAERIRAASRCLPTAGPLRQLAAKDNRMQASLAHVVMALDLREGGGERKSLHAMCNMLDAHCLPYYVRHLNIADYMFLVRGPGCGLGGQQLPARDQVAPVLVERKSVEDVAGSIADGRWQAQQRRMLQARRLPGYAGCRLIYIIEGDASERRVHGGGVGRASLNVSLAQVEREIESLSAKGFECLRSTSLRDTCKRLAEILRQVASDFGDGSAHSSACGSSSAATSGTASLMSYQDFILKLNSSAVDLNANQDADANANASVSRERARARAQVSERERESERANANASVWRTPLDVHEDALRAHTQSSSEAQTGGGGGSSNASTRTSFGNVGAGAESSAGSGDEVCDLTEQVCSGDMTSEKKTKNEASKDTQGRKSVKRKRTGESGCVDGGEMGGVKNMPTKLADGEEELKENDELMSLSVSALRKLCRERDEAISGSKKELLQRLRWPAKAQLLIERAQRGQYVPKPNSANAALMVALLLHHTPGEPGMEKAMLMTLADQIGISKDPMGGRGGFYDGWSSVRELLTGDPALMQGPKRLYSLTTQPPGQSGRDVAKALHQLAHCPQRMGDKAATCKCGAMF